tara:strand:- start:148 stop:396 length:249 start_codon:yes stop_codon:yes gene_type:complete
MDYFIIAVAVAAGVIFHWWLFVRIRRWSERDLALSMAGENSAKRDFMLEKLAEAKRRKVPKAELEEWLRSAADAQADGEKLN